MTSVIYWKRRRRGKLGSIFLEEDEKVETFAIELVAWFARPL
jgi:hypothetical protein